MGQGTAWLVGQGGGSKNWEIKAYAVSRRLLYWEMGQS